MPDLGTYAVPVLSSYAVGLGLLALIVVQSVVKGARVKRALDEAEGRAKDG